MKKRNALFLVLATFLVFGIGFLLASSNPSALLGAFPTPAVSTVSNSGPSVTTSVLDPNALLPSVDETTIYVDAGAPAGGTGSILSPYNSLTQVQSVLETDANIRVVFFTGTFNGTLNLDGALTKKLALMAYGSSSLMSSGFVIHQTTGVLENLNIHGFHVEGLMELAPAKTLAITGTDFDGGGALRSAIWLDATDSVVIADCTFDHIQRGIVTNTRTSTAVGTLNVVGAKFNDVEDGVVASYVTRVDVSDAYIDYASNGILSVGVTYLSVDKTTLLGRGSYSYGVYIFQNPPLILTHFDFQNNFVMRNAGGIFNESSSRTDSTVMNNSFYDNSYAIGLSGSGSDVYENNIIFAKESETAFARSTPPSGTSDYNLFYGAVSPSASSKLSDWQSSTGADLHSIEGDPLFASETDLHISAGSPAIDQGTVTIVSDDIDGDARSGAYDVGADEY